jgi:hypothetical protein
MAAAVADHGVGKGWRRGMAMSHAGEIAILATRRTGYETVPPALASA